MAGEKEPRRCGLIALADHRCSFPREARTVKIISGGVMVGFCQRPWLTETGRTRMQYSTYVRPDTCLWQPEIELVNRQIGIYYQIDSAFSLAHTYTCVLCCLLNMKQTRASSATSAAPFPCLWATWVLPMDTYIYLLEPMGAAGSKGKQVPPLPKKKEEEEETRVYAGYGVCWGTRCSAKATGSGMVGANGSRSEGE